MEKQIKSEGSKGYSIDLEQISINRYVEILKHQNLLPGRKVLLEEIDERFARFTELGVQNVLDLKGLLSSSKKLLVFTRQTGIPLDYLIVLKREIGSLEQKPVPLADFQGVNSQLITSLADHGIRTTKDLYDRFQENGILMVINDNPGIAEAQITEVICLSNLVRINGVGPAAARALYAAGYKNISEVAAANSEDLWERISLANSAGQYYSAKLGLKDMQFVIDFAHLLQSSNCLPPGNR